MLIYKEMKNKDLGVVAHSNPFLIARLGRNENVTVDVLTKICGALDCMVDDIIDIVPDEEMRSPKRYNVELTGCVIQ